MDRESGFGVIRRYWWIVVVFAIVGAIIGAVPEPQRAADRTVSFTATHTLLLSSTNGNIYTDPVALNQIQLFATRGEVRSRSAEKLGLSEGEINVVPSLDQATGALSITDTEADPERAVAVADTVADELTKYILERQDDQREDRLAASLQRQQELEARIRDLEQQSAAAPDDNVKSAQLDAARNQYVVVLQQYDALASDQGLLQLNTLERASAVENINEGLQAPRSRLSRGLLLGLLGAGLGCAVAFVLGRLDRRIRTRVQAESILGLRGAGVDPVGGRHQPRGSRGHERPPRLALRRVPCAAQRRRVRRSGRSEDPSPRAGGGGRLADSGRRQDVGDRRTSRPRSSRAAARRSPSMPTSGGRRSRRASWARATADGAHVRRVERRAARSLVTRTPTSGLALIDVSSVKGSPGDLAASRFARSTSWRPVSDAIVVDTSPMTATAEVLELIPLADVVLVIVRLDRTPTASAARAIDTLRAMDPPHLMLVVVGENVDRTAYYYHYSSPSSSKSRPWKRRA